MPLNAVENVWEYPRPPRLERTDRRLRVIHGGVTIADTVRGYRVLETTHPPVYYLPPEDVRMDLLTPSPGQSTHCEWKGSAEYLDLRVDGDLRADGARVERVAWRYRNPDAAFVPVAGFLAFYAGRVDEAWVDEERAEPQPGGFYGGWVTSDLVGPFKGGLGTMGW